MPLNTTYIFLAKSIRHLLNTVNVGIVEQTAETGQKVHNLVKKTPETEQMTLTVSTLHETENNKTSSNLLTNKLT